MSRITNASALHRGLEPKDCSDFTDSDVEHYYSIYTYHYGNKEAKKWILDYLKSDKERYDIIKNVPDHYIVKTVGWISRMIKKGYKPSQHKLDYIDLKINEMKQYSINSEIKTDEEVNKPSVQDYIEEQVDSLFGTIDSAIDDVISFQKTDFDILKWIKDNEITNVHLTKINNRIQKILDELTEWSENWKDADNPYNGYSKIHFNKLLRFITSCVDNIKEHKSLTKTVRQARKKKPISVEKKVSKVQYKEKDDTLGLASVSPTEIINANEVWIYNTKYKSLAVYRSKIGLDIKGTTIVGFEEEQSESKAVRDKYINSVKQIPKGRKLFLSEVMDSFTTVKKTPTGRLNKDTIILRCVK